MMLIKVTTFFLAQFVLSSESISVLVRIPGNIYLDPVLADRFIRG